MWFDEHNHPVDYDKLSPEQRRHAHRERCYKWVSLLHLRGGCFVYAGALLLPGMREIEQGRESPLLPVEGSLPLA